MERKYVMRASVRQVTPQTSFRRRAVHWRTNVSSCGMAYDQYDQYQCLIGYIYTTVISIWITHSCFPSLQHIHIYSGTLSICHSDMAVLFSVSFWERFQRLNSVVLSLYIHTQYKISLKYKSNWKDIKTITLLDFILFHFIYFNAVVFLEQVFFFF